MPDLVPIGTVTPEEQAKVIDALKTTEAREVLQDVIKSDSVDITDLPQTSILSGTSLPILEDGQLKVVPYASLANSIGAAIDTANAASQQVADKIDEFEQAVDDAQDAVDAANAAATRATTAAEQAEALVLEDSMGQSTTKAMTQRATTNAIVESKTHSVILVDTSSYFYTNYYIRHDNGNWRTLTGQGCVIIPVVQGEAYKITGSNIYAAYLETNAHASGTTPSYASGTTDEFTWTANEEKEIPNGTNYLYLMTRNSSADIVFELYKRVSIKEKLDETIEEMEDGFDNCAETESSVTADFSIEDENGNAIVAFTEGHIITKNFDSRKIVTTGKYEGKRLSILGDSISTFGVPNQSNATGTWTWAGNRCRYPQNNLFTDVKYQYWYLLLERLGMTLGINESWAGSRVSNTQATDDGDLGPNRCMSSLTRIGHLGENGTPDIILVYAGTNDAGAAVSVGTFNTENPINYTEEQIAALPVDTFADAYRTMLIRLQYYYRTSRIVCCFPTFTTSYYTIAELDKYGEVIRTACDFFGVEYVDLRTAGITVFNRASYLPDGIHPNAAGMELIYEHLVRNIFN